MALIRVVALQSDLFWCQPTLESFSRSVCCCTGTLLPLLFSVLLPAVVPAAIAIAKIASKSDQDWIGSMLATGNFTGSMLTLVPMRASAGCRSHTHGRYEPFVFALFVVFPIAWKTGQARLDWVTVEYGKMHWVDFDAGSDARNGWSPFAHSRPLRCVRFCAFCRFSWQRVRRLPSLLWGKPSLHSACERSRHVPV